MPRTALGRAWRDPVLLTHAFIVAVVLVVLVLTATVGATEDANIGAGIMGLLLGILGLPWSLPALVVDGTGNVVAVMTVAALINLGIHAGIRTSRQRADRVGW